jgi:hypothetical protein
VIVFFISCKEKYFPPVTSENLNYLVVDGTLINGPDSTFIRLSRTKTLDDLTPNGGEQNAQMTVEDIEGNTLYNFIPVNNKGLYALNGMNLDIARKYRLRINTTDGNQYVSDDITVKATPPIDSISWKHTADGLTIYANTHDPLNDTKYYRWEYSETWDYYTHYFSEIKYENKPPIIDSMFQPRNADEFVYHCWKTQPSTEILLGTSLKLSDDVISLAPVRFIPQNAFELSNIYSILVRQYSLSKESFDYFENLKRISEETGSLFDAQPSELKGNIHNINKPDQTVVGYITASSLRQQRIFITKEQADPWTYSLYCPDLRLVPLIIDSLQIFFGGVAPQLTPVKKVLDTRTGQIRWISGGLPVCADCTSRGATNVKPDFWP